MNYELAKQLKEAGFPQKPNNQFPLWIVENSEQPVQIPNLSELIEACGVIFAERLQGDKEFLQRFAENNEEAVVNLWLELNKK